MKLFHRPRDCDAVIAAAAAEAAELLAADPVLPDSVVSEAVRRIELARLETPPPEAA
jgi:hypothetical protein